MWCGTFSAREEHRVLSGPQKNGAGGVFVWETASSNNKKEVLMKTSETQQPRKPMQNAESLQKQLWSWFVWVMMTLLLFLVHPWTCWLGSCLQSSRQLIFKKMLTILSNKIQNKDNPVYSRIPILYILFLYLGIHMHLQEKDWKETHQNINSVYLWKAFLYLLVP